MNSVNLIGHLDNSPSSQPLPDGKSVTHCVIAIEDRHRGVHKRTIKLDLIFWTPMAEIAIKHLHAGQRISIIGRLTKNEFIPKGSTQPVAKVQIIVVWFELLDVILPTAAHQPTGFPVPHPN